MSSLQKIVTNKHSFILRDIRTVAEISPQGNAKRKRAPTEKKKPAPDGAGVKEG
jgi:hypothetical protein